MTAAITQAEISSQRLRKRRAADEVAPRGAVREIEDGKKRPIERGPGRSAVEPARQRHHGALHGAVQHRELFGQRAVRNCLDEVLAPKGHEQLRVCRVLLAEVDDRHRCRQRRLPRVVPRSSAATKDACERYTAQIQSLAISSSLDPKRW